MSTTLVGYFLSIRRSVWLPTSNRQFLNRGPSSKSIARLRDCTGTAPRRSDDAIPLRAAVPLAKRTKCYVLLNSESGVKVKRRGVLRSRSEERRRGHRPRTNQPVGDVRSGSVASHGVQRPLQGGPEQEDREGGGRTEQKQDAGQRAAGRAGHRHAGVRQVQVSRTPKRPRPREF